MVADRCAGISLIRKPPELRDPAERTIKSAVYSFAILLAELVTGQPPFADIHPFILGTKVRTAQLKILHTKGVEWAMLCLSS